MSVIVKGMRLPDCCGSCPLLEYDDYATGKEHHCNALNVAMSWDDLPEGRREDCPLTEHILCRECKHMIRTASIEHEEGNVTNYYMCDYWHRPTDEDGYCHVAKRKGRGKGQ